MTISHILAGLEGSTMAGAEAETAARLLFLEWALDGAGPRPAEAAQLALRLPAVQQANSAAARAFVGCLEQASRPLPAAARRARRGRLH